jgi:hypothetical protein
MLFDFIFGSVLLGAFGDAIGAAWELHGLAGLGTTNITSSLVPLCTFYNPDQCDSYNQTWGIWADPAEVGHSVLGVSTDDTAQRTGLLSRYLMTLPNRTFSEVSYKLFLLGDLGRCPVGAPPLSCERKDQMIDDLVVMFDLVKVPPVAKRENGTNKFYVVGSPACFGMYLWLQAAVGLYRETDQRVYELVWSRLDQEYGSVVAGAWGVVAARAVRLAGQGGDAEFAGWFLEGVMETLTLIPGWVPADGAYAAFIAERYKAGIAIAREARQAGPVTKENFLSLYSSSVYANATLCPQKSLHNSDPLCETLLLVMALAYTDDAIDAIVFSANMPGDADTTPSFLGIVAGAYLGESRLRALLPAHTISNLQAYADNFLVVGLEQAARAIESWASG